jgi:nicotinate-nucleotide adenylyltransferase
MGSSPSCHVAGRHTALLGGSFDPPHCGHLALAWAALEQTAVERVVFIPAGQSPLKAHRAAASAEQRLAMVTAAIAGDERLSILDWELRQPGPSYSIDTVIRFQREHPEDVLYWILGGDQVRQLEHWHRIDELSRRVRFIAYQRDSQQESAAGDDLQSGNANASAIHWLTGELLPYASSSIRDAIATGDDPKGLPSGVADYIHSHLIYHHP